MALDPTLRGAPELVGRLMMEPPRAMPPAVERSLRADDVQWHRAQMRGALGSTSLGLAVVVPLLLIKGAPASAAVYAAVAATCVLVILRSLWQKPYVPLPAVVLASFYALTIAILSHVFTPLVVAPTLAVITAAAFGAGPSIRSRAGVVGLGLALSAAVFAPAIAERMGLLAPTIESTPAGTLLHGAIRVSASMLLPVIVINATVSVMSSLVVSRAARAHERSARTALQLQAWQLRQLVADPLA